LFAQISQTTSNTVLCDSFIFGPCAPTGFLADTNYTSQQQCYDYMDSLDAHPSPCPFPQQSNTKQCRQLHGTASYLLPNVHCQHTRPNNSVTCQDSCLATCSNCHPNASCVATFDLPNSFAATYMCECKNGYTGNGTSCTPLACSASSQCPSQKQSYTCSSSNLCTCTDTFVHNPTSPYDHGYCTCPDGTNQFKNGTDPESPPVCVPIGRCISDDKRHMCQNQRHNQVKCLPYGQNTLRSFLSCLCNFGFQGGWEYPCSCPFPKTTKHSNAYDGEVCLSPGECTDDNHCHGNSNCVITPGQQSGTCSQ